MGKRGAKSADEDSQPAQPASSVPLALGDIDLEDSDYDEVCASAAVLVCE